MKQIFCIFSLVLLPAVAFSQTQQGIVKTRGRVVNGQVVAGQRLTGATITLSISNPVVSGQNGAFSFNVPTGKNYSLVMVSKQGYTLADPEYTRRSFKYSASNPFYVVLEDEAQRQADINAATKKVRRTLTAQLQAREDEIEALKAQNRITELEYQAKLKKLYANQSKSEQLVKEMAERYASTDYDQLDEFNRLVHQYIEEGELQKADSLIHSKGDIEDRVAEYHQVAAANKVVREELELSERAVQKSYEELSKDLYNQHIIFKNQSKYDLALHCMVLRAELDTLNFDAMRDCAYAARYTNDTIAEKYFLKCLDVAMARQDTVLIAEFQQELGQVYSFYGQLNGGETSDYHFSLGLNYYQQSLCNLERLFMQDPDKYRKEYSEVLSLLGIYYRNNEDYEECIKYIIKTIEQHRMLIQQGKRGWNVEDNLISEYYTLAEATYELLSANSKYVEGFAFIEESLDDIDAVAKLAIEIWDADVVHRHISETYYMLGRIYHTLKDYTKCSKFYELAVEHKESSLKEDIYNYFDEDRAPVRILDYCKEMGDVNAYDKYLDKFISIYTTLYKTRPKWYKEDVILLQYNKIERLSQNGKIDDALDLAVANLNLDKDDAFAKLGIFVASGYKVDEYIKKEEYNEALTTIEQIFSYIENLENVEGLKELYEAEEDKTKLAQMMSALQLAKISLYHCKGEILLRQGRNNEALEMWKKVMELSPNFLDDKPKGTHLSNGMKKLGLIE